MSRTATYVKMHDGSLNFLSLCVQVGVVEFETIGPFSASCTPQQTLKFEQVRSCAEAKSIPCGGRSVVGARSPLHDPPFPAPSRARALDSSPTRHHIPIVKAVQAPSCLKPPVRPASFHRAYYVTLRECVKLVAGHSGRNKTMVFPFHPCLFPFYVFDCK